MATEDTPADSEAPDALEKTCGGVTAAIEAIHTLNKEVIPAQASGLVIPDVQRRTHAVHVGLARAMDQLLATMQLINKDDERMEVVLGIYHTGMEYMQGIVMGFHWTRIRNVKGEMRPFQYMLKEGITLLDRQIARSNEAAKQATKLVSP